MPTVTGLEEVLSSSSDELSSVGYGTLSPDSTLARFLSILSNRTNKVETSFSSPESENSSIN